jgi:hypothetical protein
MLSVFSMSQLRLLIALMLGAHLVPAQSEDTKKTIQSLYSSTFAVLHEAKTKEDIVKMVDALDTPDWVSIGPTGQTMTRAEAIRLLESLLATPPDQRSSPKMDIIFMNETKWNATVLYWVYTGPEGQLTDSMARDTFARTAQGWRRMRHEKYFPDRPLVVDGKAVIAPHY